MLFFFFVFDQQPYNRRYARVRSCSYTLDRAARLRLCVSCVIVAVVSPSCMGKHTTSSDRCSLAAGFGLPACLSVMTSGTPSCRLGGKHDNFETAFACRVTPRSRCGYSLQALPSLFLLIRLFYDNVMTGVYRILLLRISYEVLTTTTLHA